MTREETATYLQNALTNLFPTNGVKVNIRKLIGDEHIFIRYTHNRDASTCANNILENDPAFMLFHIDYYGNAFTIEFPSTHGNRLMGKNKPVSFRKITGKTEQEAAQKLVAWFTKNQTLIATVDTL